MGKRVSSASRSTKMPSVVVLSSRGITLKNVPDKIYDDFLDAIVRVIGRRNGEFVAIRRHGVWSSTFSLTLSETDLRRLRVLFSDMKMKEKK